MSHTMYLLVPCDNCRHARLYGFLTRDSTENEFPRECKASKGGPPAGFSLGDATDSEIDASGAPVQGHESAAPLDPGSSHLLASVLFSPVRRGQVAAQRAICWDSTLAETFAP